jgi:hypothetical protein
MQNFIERHNTKIKGVISCFDRIVLTGTIPGICYAQGMSSFLTIKGIRIFDFTQWADPLREEIRANAEKVASDNGLEIEFIRKKNFRKEDRINEIISQRGTHPGLVHIYSAMEACTAYKPWHNKKTGKTSLKTVSGKCLHYYFYFITAELGLCYLRVPTWAPFRLQFYCNGHNLLAAKLEKKNIGFQMLDNVFVQIDDFDTAQKLADDIKVKRLHRQLDKIVRDYCPIVRHFANSYHWSFMQIEYATDIIFRQKDDLKLIYDEIVRTAIHSVKPENISTFLGRKLHGGYEDEMGNNFNTRIAGTCIKHRMGPVAVKMYDKFGLVLRVETVANDVSFFKHHRRVEHRDGTWEMKTAPLKKSIYSLPLRELFSAVIRGEFNISGFSNRSLRKVIKGKKGHQVSRLLKRLRKHGLIKKIGNTYKYYLTALGRRVTATALKLREMYIIPSLRGVIAR